MFSIFLLHCRSFSNRILMKIVFVTIVFDRIQSQPCTILDGDDMLDNCSTDQRDTVTLLTLEDNHAHNILLMHNLDLEHICI